MVESVGKKLSQARLARGLTIEEVAHATRLRPDKIIGLESDDYSRFGSNAYARGFLQIYGRYLDVDVTWHVKSLEDTQRFSVSEYQYLNSAPEPANVRVPTRREVRPPSFVPAFVFMGIVFLVGMGFWINVSAQRLGLSGNTAATTPPVATSATAQVATVASSTPAPESNAQHATLTPVPASNPAPAELPAETVEPAEKVELRADGSDVLPTAATPGIGQNGEPIAFNVGTVAVP
ncbi:MAG: helix-turn-helix domain-containing protein [Chthoniobacteraceae bacterium]